ncbi:ectonucleotide pyrophosphatase/phosphodiesterase family member 5-like isoform X2 [Gordionus sp. m RMFG-2023]|uniref:ectonucleotide pyrophosphatase/phosphodiesterase family member 5-like isoform X2 n=1 Tax=Gordionus sp. m RMFG-2023 TaxID=3053472 RepID=UPI0031FD92E4
MLCNYLLLISLDGFAWNYLDRFGIDNFPNFKSISYNGVKAKYVQNLFLTKTFPSHFSIVTGLFPESHGIVNNQTRWWDNGAEPIWVTNQKGNHNLSCNFRSKIVMWPGSEVKIKGIYPTLYTKYSDKMMLKQKINMIISSFASNKDKINLGLIYHYQPDLVGHIYGPESREVFNMLKSIDSDIGYLFNELEAKKLLDHIDIIITSDHGMTNIHSNQYVILSDIMDLKDFIIVGSSPVWNIFSNNTKKINLLHNILNATKYQDKLQVYKKNNIPLRWHYKNNIRIGDLIIIGQPGYIVALNKEDRSLLIKGNHGFDNSHPDSWPIFFAQGPSFKSGFQTDSINSIDIYELMCHILKITPAPNNGSLANIRHILSPDKSESFVHVLNKLEYKSGSNLLKLPPIMFTFTVTIWMYKAHYTNIYLI